MVVEIAASVLALVVVALAAAFWRERLLAARSKNDSGRLMARMRAENERFRSAFGGVAGWTADGRLPADWEQRVRDRLAPPPATIEPSPSAEAGGAFAQARDALAAVSPAFAVAGAGPESAESVHRRSIELFSALAESEQPLQPAMANGDLDGLIGYWLRLESFAPAQEQTSPYRLAAALAIEKLRSEGFAVIAPRPLSVVRQEEADFVTDDSEGLRTNAVIRGALNRLASRMQTLPPGEYLVADCLRPGWSGPGGVRLPRLQIWHRSWQD